MTKTRTNGVRPTFDGPECESFYDYDDFLLQCEKPANHLGEHEHLCSTYPERVCWSDEQPARDRRGAMADTEDRTPSDVDDLRWTISQGIDADPYSSKRDNEAAHAALRTLCEHVSRLTAEIDRANRALNEIIALDEKGPAWEPYDEFGDPSDIDVSNSGDQRRHGAWTAYQWAARIARAARTQPEGSNAPTSS